MIGESWFVGAMLALIGLQVLTLVAAYWRGEGPFDSAKPVSDRHETPGDGALRCPDCGAENDVEYRFCRQCVAELPGQYHTGETPVPPLGRGSR